jgi:hypothetical protein
MSHYLYQVSTTGAEYAKHSAFQNGTNKISDGAWCMERFHDRPFQDFVAHETHRLIPPFERNRRMNLPVHIARGCFVTQGCNW